jgi:hypothetical protein
MAMTPDTDIVNDLMKIHHYKNMRFMQIGSVSIRREKRGEILFYFIYQTKMY